MKCLISVVLFYVIGHGQCANILGIFPMAGKSHFIMFEALLRGLAEKGHDVDVVTHFPSKDAPPGYNTISIKGSLPIFVNNVSVDTFQSLSNSEMIHFVTHECGIDVCKAVLATPQLQALKTTTKKYDIYLTELFGTDCVLGFGHLFQIPTVNLISSVPLPWTNDIVGNPDNPAYIANYFFRGGVPTNVFDRFLNTFDLLKSKLLYSVYTKQQYEVSKEFFGADLPDLSDLARNVSLVLVNSHLSMNQARATVPNLIEVGGIHLQKPNPLNEYFEKLVATPKGVILLTMGSMIITETFPDQKLQALFDALAEFPSYTVIWKANKERFSKNLTFPANIHFEPWIPQMDLLCHPSVKLFVSHGGLLGSQEAVYCGVPRIGIPLFADQISNLRMAEAMGIATVVDYDQITKETVLDALNKFLRDSKYKERAEEVARRFKDRPLSPMETAIFWIEYVIRHKGAPELRVLGADLPWYQYHLLDVAFIFAALAFVIVYITKALLRNIVLLIFDSRKIKND